MMIKRLVVGKGKTVVDEKTGVWTKRYFELTLLIEDPSELEIAKANATGLLDGWLSAPKSAVTIPAKIPQLNPDELAKLPWKTYKKKESCGPDSPGWIFSNTKGAQALADLIGCGGKVQVEMGPCKFEVRFSGTDRQFISRKPVES